MIDETGNDTARIGFCQDCGRPLTRETARTVGSGRFCEPCLELRLAAIASAPGAGAPGTAPPAPPPFGTVPPAGYGPQGSMPPGHMPALGGENPNPVLAGLLGLIPGVGAMYNGQFAKGIAHLVIFFLLETMDHVNGLFGFLAFLWCLYQAYEAYHTAKARREGRQVPDPFGLNDIGERMGFFTHFGSSAKASAAPHPPTPGAPSNAGPFPPTPPAAATEARWTVPSGGVPFNAPFPAQDRPGDVAPDAWQAIPTEPPVYPTPVQPGVYAPPTTFAAAPVWDTSTAPYVPAAPVPTGIARFPSAAVWLIGLGIAFLLLTVDSERWSMRHLAPFVVAAFAVWIFVRRMSATGGLAPHEHEVDNDYPARLVHALRAPGVLLVLAILLGLQSFRVEWLSSTWPVLLIALGAQLLAERLVGRPTLVMPMPPTRAYTSAHTPVPPTPDVTQEGPR